MVAAPSFESNRRFARRLGAWIVVVQSLLALNWTMYVLFLPQFLEQTGIGRRWVLPILILDQAIFTVMDWFAGSYSDRLARMYGTIGRPLAAVAVASALLLLTLPWAAATGSALLVLAVVVAWSLTSSALRAPVFSMVGKVAGPSGRSGVVGLGLISVSLAGAFGPLLTEHLRGLDPRLPMTVGGLALALAALFATRVESARPAEAPAPSVAAPAHALVLAAAVLLAAVGLQFHSTLALRPLFEGFGVEHLSAWASTLWFGFAAGLLLAKRVSQRARPLQQAAVALTLGAVLTSAAGLAPTPEVLAILEVLIGAVWAVTMVVALTVALSIGGGRGAGTPLGMIFSALALAIVMRLAVVWLEIPVREQVSAVVAACWLASAALMVVAGRHASAGAVAVRPS